MDPNGSDPGVAPSIDTVAVHVGAGRYRLTECIGSGGMATVWRAEDTVLGRIVAVKLLHPEYGREPVATSRFRAEARAAASISHPNVVSVFDFGADGEAGESHRDDAPFLVMELVEGRSLAEELASRRSLPADEVAAIVEQAALGLSAAHALHLVHRDIKPGNLLITSDGTVKIADFGIARAADALPLTATGSVVGTALYISPEQAAGQSAGPSSDLYSLGVVAYTCLAGTPPFRAATPLATALAHLRDPVPALPASAPPPLRDLVLGLLAKNPADRPPDALEVASVARSASVAPSPSVAPSGSVAPSASPWTTASGVGPSWPPAAGAGPAEMTGIRPTERMSPPPRTEVLPTGLKAEGQNRRARRLALNHRRALVTLALLVAMAIGLALALPAGGSHRVPNVVGTSVATARATIDRAGLRSTVRLTDGPRSAGYVLAQAPSAGTEIGRSRPVELTVSSGLVLVTASTYTGEPYAAVASELTALSLRPVETYIVSGSNPGQVLSISPQGSVPVGSLVQVGVSVPPAAAGSPGDNAGDQGSGPPSGRNHPKPPH